MGTFQIKMPDGTCIRKLEDLREHFDLKTVIAYFLDNNQLERWLIERGYQQVAKDISALKSDDAQLCKKLCKVLNVSCADAEAVDVDEISKNIEKLHEVEALTADDEIINNVESVAFNQDELEQLYEKGVKKIYLLKGEFVIPESKKDLEYIPRYGAQVTHANEEKYDDMISMEANPEKLGGYVKIYNRKDGIRIAFHSQAKKVEVICADKEKVVYALYKNDCREDGFYFARYNEKDSSKLIYRRVDKADALPNPLCVENNKFWYFDKYTDTLHCYDLSESKEMAIHTHMAVFINGNIYALFGKNDSLCKFNTESINKYSTVADYVDIMAASGDIIAYICHESSTNKQYKLCVLDTATGNTVVADKNVASEDGILDMVIKDGAIYYSYHKKKGIATVNAIKDGIIKGINPLASFIEAAKMIDRLKSKESWNKYVNNFNNGLAVFRKINLDGSGKMDLNIQELENIFVPSEPNTDEPEKRHGKKLSPEVEEFIKPFSEFMKKATYGKTVETRKVEKDSAAENETVSHRTDSIEE